MGWNSWYVYRCSGLNERVVLDNARALVRSGMAAAGYRYVNVDACWQAKHRDRHGALQANPATFAGGMAALGRKLHAMGLEFGLYTSVGRSLCDHALPGSYGHLDQDLRTFAAWGVDYLKVDWCSLARGERPRAAYAAVHRAAARAGRPMLVTVSTPGIDHPWRWAAHDGNSWRIAPDLTGSWRSVLSVLDADAPLWPYAGPGGWNDADILQVGNNHLTGTEERAHLSLWSMLASPLLAGNDLRTMPDSVRATLTNPEVIAIDQDPAGKQGRRLRATGGHELWLRPLSAGSWAVLALNRTAHDYSTTVSLSELPGVQRASSYSVRDVWAHTSKTSSGEVHLEVPSHGVSMLRVHPG